MGELDGTVAIVTGSTRGLGRAIAERFAREGASVVVHGRDAATCADVAAAVPGSIACAGDVAAVGTAEALVDAARSQFGRLDIVVNNAGVAVDNFITGVTDDRWDASLATNLTGPFALVRAASRVMKQSGGGAVPTDMTEVMDERLQRAAASRRPLKIRGSLDDVAEGALFLVSARSRFVTGDTLHVDGGLHLS